MLEFMTALKKGNLIVKMSMFLFGVGNLRNKQIIKGLLFMISEAAYIVYMSVFGVSAIRDFVTLGTITQQEVFNEQTQVYEYILGDNSMLALLYGVVTIVITVAVMIMMNSSVLSAYAVECQKIEGQKINGFLDDLKTLKSENLYRVLLFFPVLGVVCFTVIPLVYMILIAFTSFDKNHQPPGNLFDWVGIENFTRLFESGGVLANTFWPILGWTLLWAVTATITNYIFGILLALLINREQTKFKNFFRFIFVLSIAVPQFVSLLTMRTVFNTNGPVNVILRHLDFIGPTESIAFLTDPMFAKLTIILINIWIGVPFTLLLVTGILQNIPRELYDAAKVDGANPITRFLRITMPYILFVTTPMLITQFVGNINNFNVIFLLTGGGPDSVDYYNAGKTDLLITWLFKLTIRNKDYNLGAVVGIIVFVIMAILSLSTYHRTGSFKEEEGFQ